MPHCTVWGPGPPSTLAPLQARAWGARSTSAAWTFRTSRRRATSCPMPPRLRARAAPGALRRRTGCAGFRWVAPQRGTVTRHIAATCRPAAGGSAAGRASRAGSGKPPVPPKAGAARAGLRLCAGGWAALPCTHRLLCPSCPLQASSLTRSGSLGVPSAPAAPAPTASLSRSASLPHRAGSGDGGASHSSTAPAECSAPPLGGLPGAAKPGRTAASSRPGSQPNSIPEEQAVPAAAGPSGSYASMLKRSASAGLSAAADGGHAPPPPQQQAQAPAPGNKLEKEEVLR